MHNVRIGIFSDTFRYLIQNPSKIALRHYVQNVKIVKMSSKVKTKKTFKTQEPLVNRGVPVSGELKRTVSGF